MKENDQNQIQNWMTKNVITIGVNNNAVEAANKMRRHNIGSLLVTNNKKLLGIITDTDIVQKIASKNLDPNLTKVQKIMISKIITINKHFTLLEAIELSYRKKIKRLPVVSMSGNIEGIITDVNIIKSLSKIGRISDLINIVHHILTDKQKQKGEIAMLTKSWMTPKLKTINELKTVQEASKIMTQNKFGSLPVINNKGEICGIITDTDIVQKSTILNKKFNNILIKDIMTKDVVITTPNKNIISVANIMQKMNIRRMPVVENQKIVGIITTTDIIRALVSINNYKKAEQLIKLLQ